MSLPNLSFLTVFLWQYFCSVLSEDLTRAPTIEVESTTQDWWGPATADMRTENLAELHPKFVPQAQSQMTFGNIAQVAPKTQPAGVLGLGTNSVAPADGMANRNGVSTAAPITTEVVEIHSQHGTTQRLVNGQPAAGQITGAPAQMAGAPNGDGTHQTVGKNAGNAATFNSIMITIFCSILIYFSL